MIFQLLLYYLRSHIVYYLGNSTGSLSDIAHLEEGFYHDLKGLYSKRLGLPINKYRSGDSAPAIAEDIRTGAEEVIKLFVGARSDLFRLFRPDWNLVRTFNLLGKLDKAVRGENLERVILLLESVRRASDSFYRQRVAGTRFEIRELLANLIRDFRTRCGITFSPSDLHHSLKLPYSEYNNWKRILHNFMVNAIEACESKGADGLVEVKLACPEAGIARIEIVDKGLGMDQETLLNFARRGYTKGKATGQGLGVNEDAIAFLESHGKFGVISEPNMGTTISIVIEFGRISGASSGVHLIASDFGQQVKTGLAVAATIVAAYLLLAILFEGLRFWVSPDIAEVKLADKDPINKEAFHKIIALDGKKKELFSIPVYYPQCIAVNPLNSTGNPILVDVFGSGRADLIFATSVVYNSSRMESGQNPYAECYDGRKNLLWKIALGPDPRRPVFDLSLGQEGPYTSQFYGSAAVDPLGNSLIPIVSCAVSYPTQALLLDKHGNKRAEYWHTGDMMLLTPIRDYDDDGESEYVLYGVNNCIGWSAAISILEYGNFSGQSAPYLDTVWSRAEEEKYYLFGHAWIDESQHNDRQGPFYGGGKRMSRTMFTGCEPHSYLSWDLAGPKPFNGIQLETDDGRTVILDQHANLDTVIIDTSLFSAWWYSRQAQLGKSVKWTNVDLEQLRGYRKYEHGKLMADSIFQNVNYYNWDFWKD